MTILALRGIQCLHLIYAEVAWLLVSSGTQVQQQVILDPDYLPDYRSVSDDYDQTLLLFLITTKINNNTIFRTVYFQPTTTNYLHHPPKN